MCGDGCGDAHGGGASSVSLPVELADFGRALRSLSLALEQLFTLCGKLCAEPGLLGRPLLTLLLETRRHFALHCQRRGGLRLQLQPLRLDS